MHRRLLFCWIFISSICFQAFPQEWDTDSLAKSIPASVTRSSEDFAIYLVETFVSEEDRVRALYTWISSNISYDVNQFETLSRFESLDEFIVYTLKNKKAVCQGYAEVFTDICNRMEIKAITVHGYNRINGRLKTDIGHAWNVANINGQWCLFDPTWGSGYLENGGYRKSFSSFYFMSSPDSMITSHMPFDPIWQLREFPVTHDDFIDGKGSGSVYCNYSDSLDLYYSQDEITRAENSLRRATATHANRKEIMKMYGNYEDYVLNLKCNLEITRYNESSVMLSQAIDKFNEYQELLKKRNVTQARLHSLLTSVNELVQQSLRQARSISPCGSLSTKEIQGLIRHGFDLRDALSAVSGSR